MSFHDSSHTGISIFLNKQNMALSLPLVSICLTYSYFKFVPFKISIPLILGIGIVTYVTIQVKKWSIQKREEKIASMDEDVLKDLAAEDIAKETLEEQKAAKKIRKENEKVRQRLAAEKKAAAAFTPPSAATVSSSSSSKEKTIHASTTVRATHSKKGKTRQAVELEDEEDDLHHMKTFAAIKPKRK